MSAAALASGSSARRDLGAGAGPLVGGLLLPVVAPDLLNEGTAALLAISAVTMLGAENG
jgi:uncharacterized membrane protein